MKLHLPARLRSALLACLAVVAPLTGTVATGCFVAGAAAFSLSVTHASEITVEAGQTVVYDPANTYIINGGTLDVGAETVSSAVTIGAANSTILLGNQAMLSPLRVTMAEGVNSYKLAGTGTFDLASDTNIRNANVSSANDWQGVVSLYNNNDVKNFSLNTYGNVNSTVKLRGITGWIWAGKHNPILELEDFAGVSALKITNGSSGGNYTFVSVVGDGTFERGGTYQNNMIYHFTGDISGWTGTFLNSTGQTELIFENAAASVNLKGIVHGSGKQMTVKFQALRSSVVKSAIYATGEGKLNLEVGGNGGVTFTNTVDVDVLTANETITIDSGAQMSVKGGGALNATLVNNGTLNLSGAFTVDSTALDKSLIGECTFTDGENGYQKSGSVRYTVVNNSATAKLNAQGAKITFDGAQNVNLGDDGTVTTAITTQGTIYWVRNGSVSYADTGADSYWLTDAGTLVLDKEDESAQGSVLVGLAGSQGTVKLTKNAKIEGKASTKSAADLVISDGATLTVGTGKNMETYISSFSSVALDNGTLKINAKPGVVQNLKITENNGTIRFEDFVDYPTLADAYMFTGKTTLDGDLTITARYKYVARFENLTGTGDFTADGTQQGILTLKVDSLSGYAGKLTLKKGSDTTTVDIATGGDGVDFKGISATGALALNLQIQSDTKMSEGLVLTNGVKTDVNITDGADLVGEIKVIGAGNTLTSTAAGIDLSGLNVTANASLVLGGKVTSLLMNQVGDVTMTDMRLEDGASLVYGADADTLHIAAENMLGSVKVDLNSLTSTQTLGIAAGTGLDLGIDKSVDEKLISVVADNVRDAKLDNSGDTWKLVSGVVSQYWEAAGGSGNWNGTDANWAFRDEAPADSGFVAGMDAIFSGDVGAVVTVNAAVDVQNLEIRSGDYTFENTTGAPIVVKNDLVVESENNLIKSDVEVKGALRGEGSVEVQGNISLGASSSIGELVVTGDVTMTGAPPADDPEKRVADLTVGGSSSAGALVDVDKLTVSDGASMTVKSNTTLGSLAGAGDVVLENAELTLTDGESSIGSLTADKLVLDKTVSLKVDTLTASDVTAKLGEAIIAGKTILTVNELIGATELTVEVGALEDISKLTNGSVITLATVRTGDSLSGKWDISAIESETGVTKISDTSFNLFKDSRGFGYEIITSHDKSSVTLQVTRASGGWIGTEEGMWTQTSGTEWVDGIVPGGSSPASFFGGGSSEVKIDTAGVQTVLIDVDIEQGKLQEISSYKFVGGNVTADNMYIGQGGLIIANRTEINQDTKVYSNGKLTVAEGGHLESYGNLNLTDAVTLTLESDAVLTVSGSLSAEKDVTITNKGTLTAKEVSIAGSVVNEGTLQIKAGGSIGSVQGGTVHAMDTNTPGTLKIGSANVSTLHIGTTGSTVELSEDSVIGTLYGTAEGTSLTSTAKLTLSEAAAANQGVVVSVTAQALTLNKVGNEFGILDAPVITLDLKDSALSADVAAISVESLVKRPENAAITLGFEADTFDSIPVDELNRMVTNSYKLISGVGSLALDDFAIAESIITEIARRGAEAEFVVKNGELLLSITAVQGGMIWDTADGRLTNSGYEIPEGEGLYKALDYVEQIVVSGETTIDLTAQGVGNADAMATIPQVGIIIRNPEGGGTLTIVGDAPADDGQLPDVATVIVNKDTENPVALVGKSVKVNIGLPVGTEDGILTTDDDSAGAVFATAEMKDGAVLQVNSSATVEEETVLRDTSSLSVADGAVFTTGMLNGNEKVTVSGRVNIVGVGGDYTGSYGESGAAVEFCKGAYQTIRAGKGLSLRVSGGEGQLDLADADAEMSSLGVGSGFARTVSDGSELIIRNVTLNDAAGRVEHHTLKLTESGNFVSSSELTVSLGAAETAETLGTDNAPVILDGSVRIDNSDICLKMETTKENLRALNVNPNAPMTGAKLATLATNGDVSADNEVVFVGAASLLNVVEKYYTNARLSSDGDILVDRVTDYYASKAGGMSETGSAGMEMLDKVLVELNPQTNTQDYQDLANVLNALDDAVLAGNAAEADELAASVTGASAAALGAALAGDMERQLRAIRNRTTTMGVDQSTVNHNMPYFNAWINAEYDNRKLNEDGTLSGYDYSVTGGTVGFDVDVTPRFVCGLALSALTGDMSSEGPDELEADVDSYYLTAFARTTYRRWTHTFVASVGKSDLSVDRTVSFSGGNYRTKGETEAMSFGFMYELGYVFALDADASTCLQPVFNVSVAHSSMDGYTESGSDAALEIGGVDMTTVTIGMGARLQSVVGQNMFNRASIFESRALIKVNAGDRDAEVDTALSSLPSAAGKLSCAERGPISLEIGAGITVPVGSKSGSIFLDGSAELGSEYTAVNATVGYRLNF